MNVYYNLRRCQWDEIIDVLHRKMVVAVLKPSFEWAVQTVTDGCSDMSDFILYI